jgi:hypothetical protein
MPEPFPSLASEPGEDQPLLHVTSEVWAVAADEEGIWLIGRWPSEPIRADSDAHTAAELELITHGCFAETTLMHSTSWRADGAAMVTTYLAVVACPGPVREHWPEALPVSLALAEIVGRPPTHGPLEPPKVPHWHVLLHALRHLRFLSDPVSIGYDATVARELEGEWQRHLAAFEPAIARMYDQAHQGA